MPNEPEPGGPPPAVRFRMLARGRFVKKHAAILLDGFFENDIVRRL
jgi:hypothetical protein